MYGIGVSFFAEFLGWISDIIKVDFTGLIALLQYYYFRYLEKF